MEKTPTGLPLDWHEDGTPIFERGDFIREPRPLPPDGNAVMYDELMLPEHQHLRPELRYNLVVIQPSTETVANQVWLGKSYPDEKRGYVFGRILQALDIGCKVIMQRWTELGKITDFVILAMQPLQLALIPPNYETVLINSSIDSPVRFFELQAREEQRNNEALFELEGSGYISMSDGQLQPNSLYDELPVPRIQPGLDNFKFLKRRPLYEMLTQYPKGFDFIDPPRREFFSGAV